MKITELRRDEPFRLAALPHKIGVLVRLGDTSAAVRYGVQRKRITVKRGDEVIAEKEFDAPGKIVNISLDTEVERLPTGRSNGRETRGSCCCGPTACVREGKADT